MRLIGRNLENASGVDHHIAIAAVKDEPSGDHHAHLLIDVLMLGNRGSFFHLEPRNGEGIRVDSLPGEKQIEGFRFYTVPLMELHGA